MDLLVNSKPFAVLGSIFLIYCVRTSRQPKHLNTTRSLADVCNEMLGSHQRHQLYKAFVDVASTEHDTVTHVWEALSIIMFYRVFLLVGAQMPSSTPVTKLFVTKFIVTKFIAKLFSGSAIP